MKLEENSYRLLPGSFRGMCDSRSQDHEFVWCRGYLESRKKERRKERKEEREGKFGLMTD